MGACGCGDYRGGLKFPGPGDVTYVLAIFALVLRPRRPLTTKEEREAVAGESQRWLEGVRWYR